VARNYLLFIIFCSGALRGRLLSFDEAFDGVEELVRMRPNVPGDLRSGHTHTREDDEKRSLLNDQPTMQAHCTRGVMRMLIAQRSGTRPIISMAFTKATVIANVTILSCSEKPFFCAAGL
jgi:hypothetical protein